MSLESISAITFLLFLAVLVYLDRKNIEFKYGLVLRRTQKGKKFIYRIARKYREKLKIVGNVGIIICIGASIAGLFLLVNSSVKMVIKPEEATPGVKLVIPSVPGVKMPGFVLGVPFWYWIIGIFSVLMVHEPMHALLARAEKIRIKSFGLLLLFFLPGAFVDPDEKQLKKLSMLSKLRIYAAGSFGNLILAAIFLLLILGYDKLIDYLMVPNGVVFEDVIEGSGAAEANLEGIIIGMNGEEIKTLGDFARIIEKVKPGEVVEIKTTKGLYQVKTSQHPDDPERAFVGISKPRTLFVYTGHLGLEGVVPERTLNVLSWVFGLFGWIFALNLGIGVFNLFPIKPLDGGLMFEEILTHYVKKGKDVKLLVNGVSLIVLLLVLFNLFGPSFIKLASRFF